VSPGASLRKSVQVKRFRTFAQCRQNGFVALRIVSFWFHGVAARHRVGFFPASAGKLLSIGFNDLEG
jgi:hypothetical protein